MPSFVFISQDKDNPTESKAYYDYIDYEDYVKHHAPDVWKKIHDRDMIRQARELQQTDKKITQALESDTVKKELEKAIAEEITKKLKL